MRGIDSCKEFEMPEVEVPMIFSAWWFFRLTGTEVKLCSGRRDLVMRDRGHLNIYPEVGGLV